jgi:hypothetical protein
MPDDLRSLKFDSFTFINMPSGAHLFFPALDRRRGSGDRPSGIRSLVIMAVDDEEFARELGIVTAGTLHVRLDRDAVENLRVNLKRRDLKTDPVVFDYYVENDLIKALKRDGEPIVRATERRDSGFRDLTTPPDLSGTSDG